MIKFINLLLPTLITILVKSCDSQDESLAGSFLSGLLDSITTTEDSKDCPGVCVHALATLICFEVLDDIPCPSSGMKCCVESSQSLNSTSATTTSSSVSIKLTRTNKPTRSPTKINNNELSEDKCPGDCIAEKIANYCEAYFKRSKSCGIGKKCCITKDMEYNTEDIIIPTAYKNDTSSSQSIIQNSDGHIKTKKKTKPVQKPTISSIPSIDKSEEKSCWGECVSGLFALFCDDIDSDAICPGEASCCIKHEDSDSNNIEVKPTTTPPTRMKPHTKPTKSAFPKCPGFCMLYIMAAFCERPSVLIPNTSNCNSGSVCCDNSRSSNVKTRPPPKRPLTTINTTTKKPSTAVNIIDRREECPGTCLVSLLSFTCFRNAEMTELFKCKKSGTQCCAPKSKIQEFQLQLNDTISQPDNQQPFTNVDYIGPTLSTSLLHYTSFSYDNQQTTTPLPRTYSKYVCGVKGTKRNGKMADSTTFIYHQHSVNMHQLARKVGDLDDVSLYFNKKSNERLILGTNIVPIPIIYHDSNESIPDVFINNNYYFHTNMSNDKGNRQARVVGGEDGDNGEWCWQVALINSLNQYLCGAALIGSQWVLTAAHCVTNIVRSGDAIYVRVGDYDLTRKFGSPGAQTLRVATTYIHHNHNSQTLDNDIALLRLHGQAELHDGVCLVLDYNYKLVCLPARGVNHAAGQRCTVTGYGYMGESGPIPLRVREAEIPIVSDTECIRKVNAVTEKIFILPASSFCAGGEEGNDACQGDGGSGLVCQDDGFYELAGLVSWGFGCGRLDVPGVYVKVSSFIGWINQIISVNNI